MATATMFGGVVVVGGRVVSIAGATVVGGTVVGATVVVGVVVGAAVIGAAVVGACDVVVSSEFSTAGASAAPSPPVPLVTAVEQPTSATSAEHHEGADLRARAFLLDHDG